ncbi:MAG: GTP-binding protein [Synechococcus sp. ARS1019]|nr:GTP-binding protein [Synechococcus sp. ARS1019]
MAECGRSSSASLDTPSYRCPKCDSVRYETGQIRVSGGFWSSFFDVGNRRFSSVSCLNCGYTEFYKRTVSGVQQFFDYLGSS